ncbi:YbaK/EbsC family protein [Neobacillus ginsengisoli]|uniref:Prolyl-tRNA editing enzyme YbaK/EbsC (Cys-tRNA(Pro) deacylase) n=1 Tax=Neobacillus ginsengisoli TaxID=904295 RepID=A0ABT9XX20_9BACI|nr:YbaK/EbsC family protein [Neobacillus ginsengisoli]MDQ0200122.1 prolyl-tRNA editing enzyme YbaK/EbsC (Cys-tRNA(Pro) deacylase) [Neobacillus ginsengisoli]
MTFVKVRDYVKKFDENLEPLEFKEKTNTVEEAANVLGVKGAQIAKSILFKAGGQFGLFVTAGDIRVNQKKVKMLLGAGKPKLATPEEVEDITGFKVGGVCPFALNKEVPIYLDESMKRFDLVYTAAGTAQSALPITFEKLQEITNGLVIDTQTAD